MRPEANRVVRNALEPRWRQPIRIFGLGADELDQLQLAAELLLERAELGGVEALNEHRIARLRIAESRELAPIAVTRGRCRDGGAIRVP